MSHSLLDRKAIFDLLKKRFLGFKDGYRQNIALLGRRYIGKTTIVQHFLAELDDCDVIEVYVDLTAKDFPYLFSKYIGGLLYNFSVKENLPLYDDFNLLLEGTKKHLPLTHKIIAKIQSDIKHGRWSEAHRSLISLPETFTTETNKFCLIVFDEFQNLEALTIPSAFQELGKNIMTQKRCLYIMTSSFLAEAQRILSEKLSLLFGNFEIVFVDSFDGQESQAFIHQVLGDIKIGDGLRDFLVDFTGGQPLYLNLILQELKYLTAVHQQIEIYVPLLIRAIENIIFNPWGVLSRHFEDMVERMTMNKGLSGLASLLGILASGKKRQGELTKALNLRPKIITQLLSRLIEEGVVVKNGNFFYLHDKLFKYWAKYVFHRRLKAIDPSFTKQREAFMEELNHSIDSFKINLQKDLSSRLVELLYCFDNESLLMNGRKYKLPVFSKIEAIRLSDKEGVVGQVIQATALEGPWFVIFKDQIGEGDVNIFLGELKKHGFKPLGYIVISPRALDENARIRALQERMWIWHEQELNTLSRFYDQPFFLFSGTKIIERTPLSTL